VNRALRQDLALTLAASVAAIAFVAFGVALFIGWVVL
jgi:hypothetical protein